MKGLAEVATVHPKKTLQMSPDITKNQFNLARTEWECRNYLQSLCRTRKSLFESTMSLTWSPGLCIQRSHQQILHKAKLLVLDRFISAKSKANGSLRAV